MLDKSETTKVINDHIYGKESVIRQWSKALSDALFKKNWHYLVEVLDHGRGFNDRSKQIVCDVLGVKRIYTAKGMRKIIADHCKLSVEELEHNMAVEKNNKAIELAKSKLAEKFTNHDKIHEDFIAFIRDGFDQVMKFDRKTWLVNQKNGKGILVTSQIKPLVFALIEQHELNQSYRICPPILKEFPM